MKKILLFLLIILSNLVIAQICPPKGDKDNAKFMALDVLKNRNVAGTVDNTVTLEKMLTRGDDTKRFTSSQYVKVTGYVILVKYGGAETCNCHNKKFNPKTGKFDGDTFTDKSQFDIHIELAENPGDKSTQANIVEINRYTQRDNPLLTFANIKKMVGKKVEVQGFLFFDEEHHQNAVNTSLKGNLWRATCWEIHPCMSIIETK